MISAFAEGAMNENDLRGRTANFYDDDHPPPWLKGRNNRRNPYLRDDFGEPEEERESPIGPPMRRNSDSDEVVPVMFRTVQHGPFRGDVTAVFPTIPANHRGDMTCYAHVGQHGACGREWMLSDTRPARPEEYAALKRELESIGYRLRVIQRSPRR